MRFSTRSTRTRSSPGGARCGRLAIRAAYRPRLRGRGRDETRSCEARRSGVRAHPTADARLSACLVVGQILLCIGAPRFPPGVRCALIERARCRDGRRARRTLPRGDEGAWAELVERFGRYVYAIASQGFRLRPTDAEDVFQEIFARAYERLGQLRDDAAVRPWLAQLTRRYCLDRLRGPGATSRSADRRAGRLRRHAGAAGRGASPCASRSRSCPTPAATSSIASSPATRATGRSATSSACPPGRSPAASPAAWSSCATSSREENACRPV